MKLKFVMFPSGVGFFPAGVLHDEFSVTDVEGKEYLPVSAGHLNYSDCGAVIEALVLDGVSRNLGLSSETSYRDWKERYTKSGLPMVCRVYSSYKIFFLPFTRISSYAARGIGDGSPSSVSSMDELFAYLKS